MDAFYGLSRDSILSPLESVDLDIEFLAHTTTPKGWPSAFQCHTTVQFLDRPRTSSAERKSTPSGGDRKDGVLLALRCPVRSPPAVVALTKSHRPRRRAVAQLLWSNRQFSRFRTSASRGSVYTPAHSFRPTFFGLVFNKLFVFLCLFVASFPAARMHPME